MANFFDRMKKFVIQSPPYDDDEYDEDYIDDEYYDEPEPQPQPRPVAPIRSRKLSNRDKVVSINTSINMQVVVTYPITLDEAGDVCKHLKDRMTVVVNLEKTESEIAQRISDFLCGAGYALDCSIQSISDEIFIICPSNVSITGKFQKELAASGIKIPNTAMWNN